MAYTQKNHTNDVKLMKPTNNRRAHGFRRAISAACLFVLFISGGSALAESFTYNGSTPPLQNAPDPAATANSLFPGTTADPGASGNTVTIDFTSGANPARVFGGISNIANSVGNTVNLIRGTITSRIYGGYGGTIGDATDNTVTMSGGSVGDRVVGGHSINGDAIGNRVTMSGGTAGYLYGGTAGDTGNATGNSVTMTGGNAGSIYGASAIAGNASGNSVTINGATARVTGWALGAINSSGVVENNTVTLIDGNVNSITAGQTTTGTSRNNTLIISGGTLMGGEGGTSIGTGLVENNTVRFTGGDVGAALTGGTARDGVSRGNVLIMSGGTVFASITGGYSDSGTATANTVRLTGGSVGQDMGSYILGGDVLGGSSDTGDALHNEAYMEGGEATNIYGGRSRQGLSAHNSAIMTSGTARENVYGGFSFEGSATDNSVLMSGGTAKNVYGAVTSSTGETSRNSVVIDGSGVKVTEWVMGGISSGGPANGNSVHLSDGEVNAIIGGFSTAGDASGNTVLISGGTLLSGATGGETRTGAASDNVIVYSGGTTPAGLVGGRTTVNGDVMRNQVFLNKGSVKDVYGGFSASGAVFDNRVVINSGTVREDVYGGQSQYGSAAGNVVEISGGTLGRYVYGGYVTMNDVDGDAINNTVIISGAPDLRTTTFFGGGTLAPNGTTARDVFTGNTLTVNGFAGETQGVHNFENYNFVLPASMRNGGTVLAITGNTPTDLTGANIAITGLKRGAVLAPGSTITLIDKTQGTPESFSGSNVLQGIAFLYDFDFNAANNVLLAGVKSRQVNPQLKSLSEGRLAGLAFVNQGADLIIGPGMYNALLATQRQEYGLAPFAAFSGGTSRYDTGSHVDVDGFSLLAGLAWRAPLDPETGSLLLGAFFEAGWGSYNSYNSFTSLPSVDGDGDTNYYGGGVLARYEIPAGPGGLYVEGSFRAGRVDVDFSSDDIGLAGTDSDYDSSSAYYGAHAGIGYIWNITDKIDLDLSSKYIWTHQDSDSVTAAGDSIDFDSANSQRWRSGARLSYMVNDMFTPYIGAYYDHEFDGKAGADVYGHAISEPDLTGGTGVGELGVTVKPLPDSGFALDLGVQGYMGVREGVTGTLQLKWEF